MINKFFLKVTEKKYQKYFFLLLILVIFFCLLVAIHQVSAGITTGVDFYYYWNTTRMFLQNGINPYSEQVAIQNQIGIYGHPAIPGQDPQYFRNPAYALLPLMFFSLFSFDWAFAIWMTLNIFLVLLTCHVAFPEMSLWARLVFLFIYQTSFGLLLGNYSIISGLALMVFVGFIIIQRKHSLKIQLVVGVILTLATIKPQLSWLYIIWFILYSIKNKLYPLIYSFIGTLVFCASIMLIFIPTWLIDFVRLLFTYQKDANFIPVRIALFTPFFSNDVALVLGNLLLLIFLSLTIFIVFFRMFPKLNNPIIHLELIGLTTFVFHPSGLSYEQLCLLLPVAAWLAYGKPSKLKNISWIVMFILSYALLAFSKLISLPTPIILGPFIVSLIWLIIVLNTTQPKELDPNF
jgi:hypothetical protein